MKAAIPTEQSNGNVHWQFSLDNHEIFEAGDQVIFAEDNDELIAKLRFIHDEGLPAGLSKVTTGYNGVYVNKDPVIGENVSFARLRELARKLGSIDFHNGEYDHSEVNKEFANDSEFVLTGYTIKYDPKLKAKILRQQKVAQHKVMSGGNLPSWTISHLIWAMNDIIQSQLSVTIFVPKLKEDRVKAVVSTYKVLSKFGFLDAFHKLIENGSNENYTTGSRWKTALGELAPRLRAYITKKTEADKTYNEELAKILLKECRFANIPVRKAVPLKKKVARKGRKESTKHVKDQTPVQA